MVSKEKLGILGIFYFERRYTKVNLHYKEAYNLVSADTLGATWPSDLFLTMWALREYSAAHAKHPYVLTELCGTLLQFRSSLRTVFSFLPEELDHTPFPKLDQ